MNPLWMLGVAAAGGLGAGLRYVVDIGVTRAVTTRFPWGILVVNVSGSLALGVLTGMAFAGMSAVSPEASLLIGVGFLGGYTTFSTVAVETALLGEQRRWWAFLSNGLGTALACLAAAALGVWAGFAFG